jgi:uncharacterized membrane protein (DUF4010 family)
MELVPIGIIVAAVGGLAIGVEREWSGHATGPRARFAGIRTFTLLGAIGGIAGWLWAGQVQALATVLLAVSGALVVTAYFAASRTEIDGTTEVGAIVVLGAGLLAGLGQITLASGIVAVTALILLEKSHLHAFVGRLDDEELRAAARFAVMAAVVLPLLPTGPYGPLGGVRPRDLWLLVLFISGLSFAGYVARRVIGVSRGNVLAGLLGGLVSSTNVTLTFSRASRDRRQAGMSLAYGVVAACTVVLVRVVIVAAALNASLGWTLVPYLGPPFVVGLLILVTGLRNKTEESAGLDVSTNPLQIGAALQMAALFQAVLFAVYLMRDVWGDVGVLVSGAALGLTDVDALTIAMARGASAGIPLEVAARAVVTGILANTALKLVLALVIGGARFKRVVGMGVAAIGLAIVASLAFR